MSVSIAWRPHRPKQTKRLGGGTSTDVEALEKVFGDFPMVLDEKNLSVLEGMAAVYQYKPNIYQEIMDLISKYDVIELSKE